MFFSKDVNLLLDTFSVWYKLLVVEEHKWILLEAKRWIKNYVFVAFCFYFRYARSSAWRCFLLQRLHLSQNPMRTCKQSGFDLEGIWGLCTVNNLYGFIGSLFVHDWAASALDCHQQVAYIGSRSSSYFCHVEAIWVWHVLPQSWTPYIKHIACTIANVPAIIMRSYICKHRMVSVFQTSCIWEVTGIRGLPEYILCSLIRALEMYTVWSAILSPLFYYFPLNSLFNWRIWVSGVWTPERLMCHLFHLCFLCILY